MGVFTAFLSTTPIVDIVTKTAELVFLPTVLLLLLNMLLSSIGVMESTESLFSNLVRNWIVKERNMFAMA